MWKIHKRFSIALGENNLSTHFSSKFKKFIKQITFYQKYFQLKAVQVFKGWISLSTLHLSNHSDHMTISKLVLIY